MTKTVRAWSYIYVTMTHTNEVNVRPKSAYRYQLQELIRILKGATLSLRFNGHFPGEPGLASV